MILKKMTMIFKITLNDGMPQCFCQNCINVVKLFIEFREKSILSENTLRDLVQDIKDDKIVSNFTQNQFKPNADNCYIDDQQYDMKEEFDADEGLEESFQELEDVKFIIEPEKRKTTYKVPRIRNKVIEGKRNEKKQLSSRTIKKVPRKKAMKEMKTKMKSAILSCGMCEKQYVDNIELLKHLESHINSNQCDICFEKFICWPQLFSHRLLHLPENKGTCHLCGKRYTTTTYLEHHYRKLHYSGETTLQCNQCKRSYDTPRKLRSHIRSIHSEVKYICDYCSKRFIEKSSLKSHIRCHSEKKTYVCRLCDFSCKYSTGLKSHFIRRHATEKATCKQCQRPFENQKKLDAHICRVRVHICPVCGKEFKLSNLYHRHLSTHREAAPYKCDRCPSIYKSRVALRIHMDRHNGNRTHQCEYCPAKFYTANVLVKHRRTHTGERPFVCKICGKAFTGSHNLKLHMRVHGENLIVKRNKNEEKTK
ncbi:zinc finger protein 718-like isoform X2 [Achroia grisella]|uniref:zinc finger protein 718-like isoform X2 n=1 Tax=Achroia grisella TaxID=688607 RepID=UPI0027D28291|nr:zinc finger protein 718-like isoform X2 [Achroia grisella]